MPVVWEDVIQAMRGVVVTGSGLADGKVIFANQAAPRPAPPYATINPRISMVRLGAYDEERLVDGQPGIIKRIGHRRITASINLFGPDALALAAATQDGLERYDVLGTLETVGLTVISRGELRDLTNFLETEYEERGQFDVTFGLAVDSTEDVSWIEAVEFEGEYDTNGAPPPEIQTSGTIP